MSTETGTSTQPAVIAVNLAGEKVGAGWGRARAVAVATVTDGRIDTVREAHLPEVMGRAPRVDRHGGGDDDLAAQRVYGDPRPQRQPKSP